MEGIGSGSGSGRRMMGNWEGRGSEMEELRAKHGVFIRALKRLGCEDNTSKKMDSINVNQIREEMEKICKEEQLTLSLKKKELFDMVFMYQQGQFVPQMICHNFNAKLDTAIVRLGGGDIFCHSVTPEAVFDVLDIPKKVKDGIPLSAIRNYIGYSRDKETLRLTNPSLLQAYTAPSRHSKRRPSDFEAEERSRIREEVSLEDLDLPFVRSQKEELFLKVQRRSNQQKRIFLAALSKLGGDANLGSITPEELLRVILQDFNPLGHEDSCWTVPRLRYMLSSYCDGEYPVWSPIHHNKLLEAIQHLGGNPFNEELVTPAAILQYINAVADFCDADVTNIHAVKFHLEALRAALKEDPHHPLTLPQKTKKAFEFRFSDDIPSFNPSSN